MSFLEDMGKWTPVWTKPHPSVQILTLSISNHLGEGGCAMGKRRYLHHAQVPGTSCRGGQIRILAPALGSKGPGQGSTVSWRGVEVCACCRCQAGFDPCKWDNFLVR